MTATRLPASLGAAAVRVIQSPAPADKVELTRRFAAAWRDGRITEIGAACPPDRPARPAKPDLLAPGKMKRRGLGSRHGRAAFVHAIAHIEFNAIDLAWDAVARFAGEDMPRAFFDDWVSTALDEAEHFRMLEERLAALGAAYGDMPAHDGLWQAAADTADDLLARLALVPMVLEARGLDTTPAAVAKLGDLGDHETAAILATIGDEEVPHVAAGVRWFRYLCERRGLAAVETFHEIVRARFRTTLKAPFNDAARAAAGMTPDFYAPLAGS